MPARRAKSSSTKTNKEAKAAITAKATTAAQNEAVEQAQITAEDPETEAKSSRDFILHVAQDRNVKFVRLWFTDILGMLKSSAIVADELDVAMEEGVTFDGSAIEGYAREDESDMIARPDPHTFVISPSPSREMDASGGTVARMFCDIYNPDGTPSDTDPRYILKRQLRLAADMGYTFYVGPEVEFFYFKKPELGGKLRPEILDEGGYFDLTPDDIASPLRRQTALTLEKMDIGVESSHHEGSPSQHEIDLRYTDALTMADSLMTFRLVVKEVAVASGYYATFMPKPFTDCNGSGMHINMSLFQGGKNAFFDEADPNNLSQIGYQFIAGLLRHAREITLFTNQWVNSYKRLVPGFEAPTRVTWAMRNRADLIRVPSHKPGREASRRVEYRSPDAACNPYLVFALLLAAGLEGVKNNYELPLPANEISESETQVLPSSLNEAILAAEQSELARRVLGDALFDKFLANKRIEWEKYRMQVHQWELDRYLGIL